MNLVKVESTNLQAVGYDKESRTMRILFQEGSMYDYSGVSEKVHGELMDSDSLGSYFQQNIVGRYRFKKINPEKESTQMGKNKQQAAAEQRAAKSAPASTPTAVAEAPKPAAPAATPTAQPNKQAETIAKLKAAWAEKKIDLSKLSEKQDGKFVNLIVDEGWPTVRVGNSGGITVMELRSYAVAFDAAVDGKTLFEKQRQRDAKKASGSVPAPAPAPPAPAAPAPAAAPESTTAKKKRQAAEVEATIQAKSA